jgi:parvulin-like peptidyl-prolyl isomerase
MTDNAWSTPVTTTVARNEAITQIQAQAREEGIRGSFKVYYNDQLIANPNDLPEQVNMDLVRVSAVLDNA